MFQADSAKPEDAKAPEVKAPPTYSTPALTFTPAFLALPGTSISSPGYSVVIMIGALHCNWLSHSLWQCQILVEVPGLSSKMQLPTPSLRQTRFHTVAQL